MQAVSANLQAELNKGPLEPRVLVDLYEFYEPDYVPVASSTTPGTDGFDPADAVETFAAQTITWNGIAYRRSVVSRGDVVRNFGEKTNSCSINFSNIDRYVATWAQTQDIEGLFLVIRTVCPTVTDDSIVLFVGRCDKPSDIDKQSFSLSARQDFGNINQELPPRRFTPEDPNGRTPSDPLYEGFRIAHQDGGFGVQVEKPSTGFFGRIFGKTKSVTETRQWSSTDGTPYGSVVPLIVGRCQMELICIFFKDTGYNLGGIWVVGEGRLDTFENVKVHVPSNYLMQGVDDHYGDPGGTLTNALLVTELGGYLSKSAYTIRTMYGSPGDVVEEAPLVTALVRGLRVPTPNSSGVFSVEQWTDNPAYISRFVLTDPRLVNIDSGFMEDPVNYATGLHCDEPLIDDTNDQIIPIASADAAAHGVLFNRYRATGIINTRRVLFNDFADLSIVPELEPGPIEPIDPLDPPAVFPLQRLLRKRYTCNVPITDAMRAVDFLYKVVFPSAKLFLRINKRGKYEIRSEKPSDYSYLRAATAVGATSVLVLDVTPWKSGDLLTGRLLVGFNQITAEVRNVLTAVYSADSNAITLTAAKTGTVTTTASGATLSGGSTTVQASGTVTIGGAPAAGDTITATIAGIAVTITLNADDTTGTAAALLAQWINATPRLSKFIRASWVVGSPTIVTISALYGVLNLDAALLKVHATGIVDPTTAPTVAATAGGTLLPGTHKLAYANANALGQTALTALASIVVTLNQKIDVSALPALPAGITSRNFYSSDQADSAQLKFVANRTDAADFSISDVPLPGAALPPSFNTTAEELLRVAMSFATNSQDVFPVWPASTLLILSDVYLPTVPNGHKYQVTTAGTTGASEPTWPTTAGGTVVNGGVTFTEIGSTVLQQAGLTRSNIVKNSYKWPLGSKQSSVNQSKGSYRDSTNDFVLTPIRVNDRAHQTQVKKIYPHEINCQAIDSLNQTLRILNWDLAKHREGDWFNSLGTGPNGLVLEEGDIICASDDSGGHINVVTRIEELRIKANHEVSINQGRKYSSLMFSDDVGALPITIPSTLRLSVTADSIAEFIDNFPIRESDGLTPGFYVAVSRDLSIEGDWRGWALYADYGDGYVLLTEGDIPAFIGDATDTLDTVTDATVFDTVSEVTFTLKFGPLAPFPEPFSTVTQADLDANPRRNLFLIGNEYVQAATIVVNGNRSYTISDFYRGRFGTDGTELAHGAGERVVYLDGSEKFVEIDPTRVNLPFNYKVVTVNQDVADATAVPFTWTGGTVKPLRYSDPVVTQDATGDYLIAATLNPHPLDPTSGVAEFWVDEDRDAPLTDLKLSLPMVTGTTQAALMASTTGAWDDDEVMIITNHAFKNNVFSNSGAGTGAVGTSIQAIEETFQRFDFEMTCGNLIGNISFPPAPSGFGTGFGAALHMRANPDAPYATPLAAACPLSVEWYLPTDYYDTYPEGTVREVWRTYSTILLTREGIDPGKNGCAIVSNEVVDNSTDKRPGPRYTFLINGKEIAAYQNFKPAGGNKHIVKIAIGDDDLFPLRLTTWCGSTDLFVRNIMYGGAMGKGTTILSVRDQIAAFGSAQTTIYIRLYQTSRYPGIQGTPLDLVMPPP